MTPSTTSGVASNFWPPLAGERACQIQLDAGAAGTLNILGDNLAAKSGADVDGFSEKGGGAIGDLEFAALIRKIDKTDTSWRH